MNAFKNKHLVKTILLYLTVLFGALMVSCSKADIGIREGNEKLTYPYLPEQPLTIDVEIVPTEDVVIDFDDMLKEVNADYYNRYGIGVNLILKERQRLSDAVKFNNRILLPQHSGREPKKAITVYIIAREYLYFDGALGYAVLQSKSIVLREDAQKNRALAHELAHVLGLGMEHSDEHTNVMYHLDYSTQYTRPDNFTAIQINRIKVAITEHNNL